MRTPGWRSGWTLWLGLKSGDGWVFDVSPKDKTVRMAEVEVLEGHWSYTPIVERVPLLPAPSPRAAAAMTRSKGYTCLSAFDVVIVSQKVRLMQMKGSFLRLADGRGWVVDFAEGRQLMRRVGAEDARAETPPAALPSSPSAAAGAAGSGSAELHEWEYAVVDPGGLSLRSGPDYASAKLPVRLEEGELVTAVERRPGDGTVFLRLAQHQGWAFDMQPGARARLRLVEVHVEHGHWHYVVAASQGSALRSRCSFSDGCKVGPGPKRGSLLDVTRRVRLGEATFLGVEGGWLADARQGTKLIDGPVATAALPPGTMMQVRAEQAYTVTKAAGSGEFSAPGLRYRCSPNIADMDTHNAPWGSIVQGVPFDEVWLKVDARFLPFRLNGAAVLRGLEAAGVHLSRQPTDAQWAATKLVVLDKAQVQVTLLCQLEGIRWARVASVGGGMEGWLHQRLLLEL